MQQQILLIGTVTRDIIVEMSPRAIEKMSLYNSQQSWMMLEAGRKVEAEHIKVDVGGGAVNAAVSFTRLGHKASVIAKVGNDAEAEAIVANLQRQEIGTTAIIYSKRYPTARSVLVVGHGRNPAVLIDRGANGTMQITEISETAFAGIDMLYIGNLSNQSALVGPWAAKLAQQQGARVLLNPGSRQINKFSKALGKMLSDIDILVLNSDEAMMLFQRLDRGSPSSKFPAGNLRRLLVRRARSHAGSKVNYWQIAELLLGFGVSTLVITDGRFGSWAFDRSGMVWHCPAQRITAVSTIGAGDGFTSCLASIYLSGDDMTKALQCATLQASSVISHLNTQDGLLTLPQLQRRWQQEGAGLQVTRVKV